jgi:DeoR family fructose operon transcriptional repressor
MYAAERQQWLLNRTREAGRVDVAATAEELDVTPETIRRDLGTLERQGLLRRVHGGAIPADRLDFEPAIGQRDSLAGAEKERIAKAALHEIPDEGAVLLDAGSTTSRLADLIPLDRQLTVVTNAVPVAVALATRTNITVLLLGGRVRGRTLATVDHWASGMLSGFVIDLAFVGANGISREVGLTTPDPAVADVKAHAVRAARRRIFAGIHTKFGVRTFCRFAEISDFESLVTDTALPASEAHRYSRLGPQVIRA